MSKVLIVEDDSDLAFVMVEFLNSANHVVESVSDGVEGLDRLLCCEYDVVVLDWSLPRMSGLEVMKEYRSRGGKTPILMLTGRGKTDDKEAGLDAGADDYLTKPFEFKELVARLRALVRRPAQTFTPNEMRVGELVVDTVKRRVMSRGVELHLQPMDFALLEFLVRHPNEIFSSEALLKRVWHSDSEATDEAVRSAVKRIRRKLDDNDCTFIENIPRIGYRLCSPPKGSG